MNDVLNQRLNQIPEKITSETFLQSKGLGNELGFWVFDYAPEDELKIREYIYFLENDFSKKNRKIKIKAINLLKVTKDYLDARGFTDKAIKLQQQKGDASLLKALRGPLNLARFGPYLVESSQAMEQDIVIIYAVGSIWPLFRAHDLLNSLHATLDKTPLILFYPGYYSGQSLCLFNKLPSNNYYRAFKLVP